MSRGWICVDVPAPLRDVVSFTIHVEGASGPPGTLFAAPAGQRAVFIEAGLTFPDVRAGGCIAAIVPVTADRITRLRLPAIAPAIQR